MGQCIFNTTSLLRPVRHALNAPEHETNDEADNKPKPALLFVHDTGVYIMSNGVPRDLITDDDGVQRCHVVYAAGCDPKVGTFDEWYGHSRDLVGGDDFVEVLSIGNPDTFMTNCLRYKEFVVDITDTRIETFFRGPRAVIDSPVTVGAQ